MDDDPDPVADQQQDQTVDRVDETAEDERPLRSGRRANAEERDSLS